MNTLGARELLTLLAIIIALSAYLATMRGVLRERIRGAPEARKQHLRVSLYLLILPDALLVISGLLLGLHIFYAYLPGVGEPPVWLLRRAIQLFIAGGLCLVVLHLVEWLRALWRIIE